MIAPEAEILCAFPSDSGTGGHRLGRCGPEEYGTVGGASDHWPGAPAYTGKTLKDALEQQVNNMLICCVLFHCALAA